MGPRPVVFVIAGWSLIAGLMLLGAAGPNATFLGVAATDARRLLGAQLLVLSVAYVYLGTRWERLNSLLWLPFASQAAYGLICAYNVLEGATDVEDGLLPMLFSLGLAGLLAATWITSSRRSAIQRYEDRQAPPDDDELDTQEG